MKRMSKILVGLALILGLSFAGVTEGLIPQASAACTFIKPADGTYTSGFRPPGRPNHHGVDIAKSGTVPIKAAAAGTVSKSYYSTSYGEVVFIKHKINGVNYETVYAHMRSGSRTVKVGNKVTQGQRLGYMGSTGDSTGQHLHFEIHKPEWTSSKKHAVNPMNYLNCKNSPPKTGDTENFSIGHYTVKKQFTVPAGSTITVKPGSVSQNPHSIKIRLTNTKTGNYVEETVPKQDGKFTNMKAGTFKVTLYQMKKGAVSGKVSVKTSKESHSENFKTSTSSTMKKQFTVGAGKSITVKPSSVSQKSHSIKVRLTNVKTGNYTEETVPKQDGKFTNMKGGTYKVTLYQMNSGPVSGKVTVTK
ncbi:M23 family metallopeptidase [Kroppenstedtia eburnea]|uniref:Peptidase family M23 n=1 Tax=Kroppenstedtia eburnea TaxID=714067 RepID=A0A1N7Q0C5_9BACL|nr:M23 family metallopeptidase [Kroppenstedtia eburnea]SIT16286.1 Peptidase family M23 [Kroppenstedtia eburnea]